MIPPSTSVTSLTKYRLAIISSAGVHGCVPELVGSEMVLVLWQGASGFIMVALPDRVYVTYDFELKEFLNGVMIPEGRGLPKPL